MTEGITTGSAMSRRQPGRSLRELRHRARITPRPVAVTEAYTRTVIQADYPGVDDAGSARRLDVHTAREQLTRPVAASELPTVSLRVIPLTAGLHHGIRPGLPGQTHEVDRYNAAFRNIRESSLDERASRELITQVARELGK